MGIDGIKTYIVGGIAVIAGIASILVDIGIDKQTGIVLITTGLAALGLRHGIKKSEY